MLFTRKQLFQLILPLIAEQFLAVSVGLVDVMMVSRAAGEAGIAGVSLVDTLNVLLITLFSSLATGGAVVSSQYLGKKEADNASKAGGQLIITTLFFALIIMAVSLIGNENILRVLYGEAEKDIMKSATIYFFITAFSFPFLAVYNSCAALFRAMGNSKISMYVSIIMNLINIAGIFIMVFLFHMGVEGVAVPTLVARAASAVIIFALIRQKKNIIHVNNILHAGIDFPMIKRILNIGVPNGLENSIFQIGKILVQGLITSLGGVAIAANGVAGTIAGFALIPGSAMGLAMITVVGRCVGAEDIAQAKKYTVKLMKLCYLILGVLNIGIFLFRVPIIGLFDLSGPSEKTTIALIIYHSICCCIIWPLSFVLPNALRAANDVKTTMGVSIISMWVWRIGFSYFLVKGLHMGVMGVWVAMTIDWLFRGICFTLRFAGGRWGKHAYLK
ncbi:MATE family efflux transporter [Anaerocolumna xylanovorans]|uniref:Probable multidrug resistance protein NorM n=1 Tax=Anaerocolumna xylanovorans DSM 12503 TaxID=1121345 RepID=A0A1M7YFP6_9FIRM|nr:MATE family efflux transporter [Anaerocolumna xylanovorans]SHO51465.1 putative efflux protein, MATE family [Anaerocolumna xylanovorans DSM 12503]